MLSNRMQMAAAGRQARATFIGSDVNTATANSYTFSSKSLGAAAPDRDIFVITAHNNGGTDKTVTGVTVDGVSATQIVAAQNDLRVEIWKASVPTGTSGDIVVSLSGDAVAMGIGWFRATGADSTAHDTVLDNDNSNPLTGSIDVPMNGFVLLGFVGNSYTTRVTMTGVTEEYDEAVDSGNDARHAGGLENLTAPEASRSLSVATGGSSRAIMVACSFGPA